MMKFQKTTTMRAKAKQKTIASKQTNKDASYKRKVQYKKRWHDG